MGPEAKDILDLPLRRRIMEAIRAHPGLHLRGLGDRLDVPVSTVEYHCYHLERAGQATSRESGGFKAFFPAKGVDRRDKDILGLLRHETPRRICAHLAIHPGTTPKDLREEVGVSAPTLSFHLKRLREAGALREVPEGRTKRLSLVDGERVASLLVAYRASFVDQAVDRFVATWTGLNP